MGVWSPANRFAGKGCKPVYAADFGNELVVNDTLKGSLNCQVRIQEMTARELLKKRRNLIRRCQNWSFRKISGQVQRLPAYRLHDIRRIGSMTCIQGNLREHGNSTGDAKGATDILWLMKKTVKVG